MSDNNAEPNPQHNDHPAVWPMVIADMQERHRIGIEKYGTPLQSFNGRRALVDLYQELLDAVVYAKQELLERDRLREEVERLRSYANWPRTKKDEDDANESLSRLYELCKGHLGSVEGKWLSEAAIATVEQLEETNQKLNRRCQLAEAACKEYLSGSHRGHSFGRALLTYACTLKDDEIERLRQRVAELESRVE